MIKIEKDSTKSGRKRIVIELENGDVFKGYENGKQYQFNGKNGLQNLCSLTEDEIKSVFEKANTIALYDGEYISFLKQVGSTNPKRGNQSVYSKDGLYKFGYYYKKSRGGIVIAAWYEGHEHTIREGRDFTIEEADNIIHEVCEEYDSTGRFKSERTILRGQPFPHEYFKEIENENLSFDVSLYNSITGYILNGFDESGNSLLAPNETLTICSVDGFEISVSDTDSLRVNDEKNLIIIHIFNQPEDELVIPIDKISRVLLLRG